MATSVLNDRSRRARLAIVVAAFAAAIAAPAYGAQAGGPPANWLPWLGCWQLVNESGPDGMEGVEGERTVCLIPSGEGVALTTRVDGVAVLEQTVIADGRERSVDDSGCSGVEQANWSADNSRLFVTADLACEGGHRRVTSGISMLSTSARWTDIQVAEVDGHREIMVKVYRRVDARPTGASQGAGGDLVLAAETARRAASAPLDPEDVVEALRMVDQAAVEAMLMESGTGFDMNADLLVQLADSDVPGDVIDLMVALSYPDYFMVNDEDGQEYDRSQRTRGWGGYGPGWGYPVWAYGYWSPAFSPFSYGYYYTPIRHITILPGSVYGGRVVKGRGYTRVQTRSNLPGGGLSRLFSRGGSGNGGSGSSGGTMTRQGASQGSGSSSGTAAPRTAKPRGGI